MDIHYQDSWVLVLNITVIVILTLLIIPTLLNTKEKLGVRLSFSAIFMIVAVNCMANIALFYYQNIAMFDFLFLQGFIPFLFGPATYFYVVLKNGGKIRRVWIHFIIPLMAVIFGLYHISLEDAEKARIFKEVNSATNLPYNIMNTVLMSIPLLYFYLAKRFLKRLKAAPGDPLAELKSIKKKWSHEFINLLIFCVFSFLLIIIIATYFYRVTQPYLDLIGMPLYFPVIYAVIAVRSNMISKELELQFELSKVEEENRLRDHRIAISRDLHDNIGAYANSLISKIDFLSTQQSKSAAELDDLRENAENIMGLLRQTIWVLNNDTITAESFFDYVKQYGLKSFRNSGIEISFDEQIGNNRTISSEISINLFRMVQEALQNVLKHANARHAKVIFISENNISISVKDDGCGFDERKLKGGNGFTNMRTRAESIGYNLQMKVGDNGGTEISLQEIRPSAYWFTA